MLVGVMCVIWAVRCILVVSSIHVKGVAVGCGVCAWYDVSVRITKSRIALWSHHRRSLHWDELAVWSNGILHHRFPKEDEHDHQHSKCQ